MNKSILKLAVSAALLGASLCAHAGADVGQVTLGAGVMGTDTDGDRGLDDGQGFYYSLGKALNEKWDFSLNGFSGNHDEPGTTWDHEIKGLTADFARVFRRESRLSPFLLFGAGVVDQTGATGNEVVAKLGLGATADLINFRGGNKLQLKGDVAARGSVGRGIIDGVANLGLQLALGGKKAEPVAVVAAAPPPPPPPPPAAPPPPPPPPPAPPPDDDRDGVLNTADRCPATPAGERVDTVGCPFQVRLQVLFETN
ncbi:MAG TPA: outer membrane beta-barrel protein, partial [Steroidobacteraceae bacterium]|nr:outer membrane beta-barrel protein [Steroidobacteraceae bacterium]